MTAMCYIACDPQCPGAAWGLVDDTPENTPFLDRDLTLWRNSGTDVVIHMSEWVIRHVSYEEGLRYLHNYVNRQQMELFA